MTDVQHIEKQGDAYVLNTGSPHFVRFVENVETLDMRSEGRAVRYAEPFRTEGINVNLAQTTPQGLHVRTYERGVEDETLACGTGVTAAAIAQFFASGEKEGAFETAIHAQGGDLSVRFRANSDGTFGDIWLCGPAKRVFEGSIEC